MKLLFSLALAVSVFSGDVFAQPFALEPPQESVAYKRFSKRPVSEMSKLIYLIDRFKGKPVTVIYGGHPVAQQKASVEVKKYIAKYYKKGEDAALWVKKHGYRSKSSDEPIFFKYPDGKTRLMRDVLLEELKHLESALKIK